MKNSLLKFSAISAFAFAAAGCVPPSGQALFNSFPKPAINTAQNNATPLVDKSFLISQQPEDSIKMYVDPSFARAHRDVVDTAKKIALLDSCVRVEGDAYLLNQYAAVGRDFTSLSLGYGTPQQFTAYHRKGRCMVVESISGFRVVSPTTIRFDVRYKSDVSGEIADRRYELRDQGQGQGYRLWLRERI